MFFLSFLFVHLHHFSKIGNHKEVTKPYESRFFLPCLLCIRRIRIQIRSSDNGFGSGSATLLWAFPTYLDPFWLVVPSKLDSLLPYSKMRAIVEPETFQSALFAHSIWYIPTDLNMHHSQFSCGDGDKERKGLQVIYRTKKKECTSTVSLSPITGNRLSVRVAKSTVLAHRTDCITVTGTSLSAGAVESEPELQEQELHALAEAEPKCIPFRIRLRIRIRHIPVMK